MALIPADECHIWWARLGQLTPALEATLSASETGRAAAYRHLADRRRSALGAALLRHAVGATLSIAPLDLVVERRCGWCDQEHGRPVLPGTGLQASVSHSGDVVAVALTGGAPVGVDVERVDEGDSAVPAELVLGSGEALPQDSYEFYVYWTRKEAVVKATGEGLSCPMTEVIVSAPRRSARLISYRGLPLRSSLRDLGLGRGHAAAVAVLAPGVRIEEHLLR